MNKITKYLNHHILGNVFDKPSILEAYSRDRSPLQITPRFVAVPHTTEDVQFLVRFANDLSDKGFDLPITVRGSGLDKTGADLGDGLVISTEKLNKIQEIDERGHLVRVQAGVTLEKLNAVLGAYGLTVPITAHPGETIGGLISNFPTDPGAHKYGSIYYYVDRIEAVLSNGDIFQSIGFTAHGLAKAKTQDKFEGELYTKIDELVKGQPEVIASLRNSPKDFSGYRMITQVSQEHPHVFDLMPLFFAAQGTLGVITEVILRCEPIARKSTHLLAAFNAIRPAQDFAKEALSLSPASLDLFDARIFRSASEHGKNLEILNPALESGYYLLVKFNDHPMKVRPKLKKLLAKDNATHIIVEDESNTSNFTSLDSVITSYLNDDILGERLALADDARIPTDKLPAFVSDLRILEEAIGHAIPLYGSIATNLYTVRPDFDLSILNERKTALRFLQAYSNLVSSHSGSLAGGSAEGRLKGVLTTPRLGTRERDLYHKIKNIFDPKGILNPSVKLGSTPSSVVRHLRTTLNQGIITE
jgi:FAD/FMN-containing dehydrogenase